MAIFWTINDPPGLKTLQPTILMRANASDVNCFPKNMIVFNKKVSEKSHRRLQSSANGLP